MSLSPGALVRVRSRQYLVEAVTPPPEHGQHTLVSLACVDDDAQGERLDVLWELELDARVLDAASWADVHRRGFDPASRFAAYLHAQRWACVTSTDAALFQSPHRAGIRIDRYQLEPLRKALRLPRVNLFIADDVGLGKTIEAGLILRELILRQRVRRVVVAAPPSVVTQWREELDERFGLSFVTFDRAFVNLRRRERGWATNPWTTHSRFIISHALLRDEDYAAPLRDWLHDASLGPALLILDEAHNAAPASGSRYAVDSKLTRAVRELAPLFEHRLFLSATPHNGHSNSFAALMEILDPQRFCRGVKVRRALLNDVMVRRLKSDLAAAGEESFPRREVHELTVDGLPPDHPSLTLPALLDRYAAALEAAAGDSRAQRNSAAVMTLGLQKRLLSSVEAFARTLAVHRRTVLARAEKAAKAPPAQTELVTDAPGPDDEAGALDDATRAALEDDSARALSESTPAPADDARALLDEMSRVAETARHAPDPRVEALVEWLRERCCPGLPRAGDPPPAVAPQWSRRRVLIFTEYADTQRWLARVLREAVAATDEAESRVGVFHGALGDDEREALKRAFNAEPDDHPLRVLIATDAAREGVNLQNHCADLFHFDVPWNPSRMEQRNGRIDRKLQRAPVVHCHYFAFAQRPEDHVLRVLVRRAETARRELGSLPAVLERRLTAALDKGLRRKDLPDVQRALEVDDAPATAASEDDSAVGAASAANAKAELEATREAAALDERLNELGRILDRSRAHLKLDEETLEATVSSALRLLGAPPLEAMEPLAPPAGSKAKPVPRWRFPELDKVRGADPTWAEALDALRPPMPAEMRHRVAEWRRKTPPRPVVFRDPGVMDRSVVHLHLEHRVVRRLLGRFLAQGFVHDDLARACVLPSSSAVHRVALLGRLSLYGPGASRLHDEVLAVTAQWTGEATERAKPLVAYRETTHRDALDELDAALRAPEAGDFPPTLLERFARSAAGDVAELLPALATQATIRAEAARSMLDRRAADESKKLTELLEGQRAQITREVERLKASDDPRQATLPMEGLEGDAARQREADQRYWSRRLARIEVELADGPREIRAHYGAQALQVTRIGLV